MQFLPHIKSFALILTAFSVSACSNWTPEECNDGVRCTPGSQCTADRDDCMPVGSLCGNGSLDGEEACDDGNIQPGDGCNSTCDSDETCGNGEVDEDEGELCDDGNNAPLDGCSSDCMSREGCGNGTLDEHEQCDDGDDTSGDGCSKNCTIEECGNDKVDAGEDCDGTDTLEGKICSPLCRFEECGNGILDPGEACDPVTPSLNDRCSPVCQLEYCGNGIRDLEEECDCGQDIDLMSKLDDNCTSSNSPDGGYCRTDCVLHCGDGKLSEDEQCDDASDAPIFCANLELAPDESAKEKAMGMLACDECEIDEGGCQDLYFVQSADYDGSAELRAVWGTSWNNVVVVGADGTILRYTGETDETIDTWEPETSAFQRTIYGVWGREENWYAVGSSGTVLSSNADGTWESENILSAAGNDLRGIWGSSTNNIYAVGVAGTILHRRDNGWDLVALPFEIDETLRSVWGTGPNDIYVVGEHGTILHFTDEGGGAGWKKESAEAAKGEYLYGVWGIGGQVFAVGGHGTILHRVPRAVPGQWEWIKMDVPTNNRISAIWGTSETDIVAAGHNGTVLRYDGQSWTPIRSSTEADFKAIWAIDSLTAVAVGTDGSIFRFAYERNEGESSPADGAAADGNPF
jgi:cysteine-rich repeat protein